MKATIGGGIMVLTCHDCPKQISFPGANRDGCARAFGWSHEPDGRRYRCSACAPTCVEHDNAGAKVAA